MTDQLTDLGNTGQEKMVDVFSDQQPAADAATNPIGWEIGRLADEYPDVVALSADMSRILADLRARHPERYFEMGIAETNTISVAAGLAAVGLRPYVVSMAPFGMLKCAEQIRTDLAFTKLPVRVVARMSGLAMGFFGPSHHAIEDIPIARSITNLTVVAPADANATVGILRSTFGLEGPLYCRVSEKPPPVYAAPPRFEFGKWVRVRDGGDLTIIATGSGVGWSMGAAAELAAQGISAAVLDAVYLKPADEAAILGAAAAGPVLTVEEHTIVGGLGSLVAETIGRAGVTTRLATMALPDEDLEVGVPADLYKHYGFTPAGVAARARALLRA
jgi:transketolase